MPQKPERDSLFELNWKKQADHLRAEADLVPFGPQRDELIKQARQLEKSHMKEWLGLSGL